MKTLKHIHLFVLTTSMFFFSNLQAHQDCIPITHIEILGANHLHADRIDSIINHVGCRMDGRMGRASATSETHQTQSSKSEQKKNLCRKQISTLIHLIETEYSRLGLIGTRIFLIENPVNHSLTVQVVEATVHQMTFNQNNKRDKRRMAFVFQENQGDLLTEDALLHGFDVLHQLPHSHAKISIEPGPWLGRNDVVIQDDFDLNLDVKLTVNNDGNSTVGHNRYHLQTWIENPLGINDLWVATLSQTKQSNAASLAQTMPYGFWQLNTQLQISENFLPLLDNSIFYHTLNKQFSSELERILFRRSESKLGLFAGFAHQTQTQQFESIVLPKTHASTFNTGVKWNLWLPRLTVSGKLNMSQTIHFTHSDEAMDEQYFSFENELIYASNAFRYKHHERIVLDLNGDNLTDLIDLGGRHSIRGLPSQAFLANSTWNIQNEWNHLHFSYKHATPFLFLDMAEGWRHIHHQRRFVMTTGLGSHFQFGKHVESNLIVTLPMFTHPFHTERLLWEVSWLL